MSERGAGGERRGSRKEFALRSTSQELRESPMVSAWIEWLADQVGEDRLNEAAQIATEGVVRSIDFTPGSFVAHAADGTRRTFECAIHLRSLTDEWDRTIDIIASHASLSVGLLDDSSEGSWIEVLGESGVDFNARPGDVLETMCGCRAAQPCIHVATTLLVGAEGVLRQPDRLFVLRGMRVEDLVDRARRRRAVAARGRIGAHPDIAMGVNSAVTPSEEIGPDEFWAYEAPAKGPTRERHVSHALLRRLGPPPMADRFPVIGLLASICDSVEAAVRTWRDESELISDVNQEPQEHDGDPDSRVEID